MEHLFTPERIWSGWETELLGASFVKINHPPFHMVIDAVTFMGRGEVGERGVGGGVVVVDPLGFFLWPILLLSLSVSAVEPISLYNLFTSAVMRAQHLHTLAADLYKTFEKTLPPDAHRQLSKLPQMGGCYSDSIPTPTGKDETQEKSDGYLLQVSSTLIQSWMYPLKSLSDAFSNTLMLGTSDGIFDKLEDLSKGIHELMKVVGDGDIDNLTKQFVLGYENFDVIQRNDVALMKNDGLLACFKKDMHKVETYLKVTKCRRFVESNCTL
ncbi:hypothetical protein JZ751_013209 [Albula glossodonta]|uniref:Growth hormone n=1 Tax=Albula glossodonta TaxID=121402 RepID=A0A8T2P2H8_9TELE|nr:hypothetical protein JZ751_013209 [Albula glossodonta]